MGDDVQKAGDEGDNRGCQLNQLQSNAIREVFNQFKVNYPNLKSSAPGETNFFLDLTHDNVYNDV